MFVGVFFFFLTLGIEVGIPIMDSTNKCLGTLSRAWFSLAGPPLQLALAMTLICSILAGLKEQYLLL